MENTETTDPAAAKVEAAKVEAEAAKAAKEAAEQLKRAREVVKAAKAKVKALGQVPTCTSTALRLAAKLLDSDKETWLQEMAAAGYENGTLNKAAEAMRNQCIVIVKHLRHYGHLLPVFETEQARFEALSELTADAEERAEAEAKANAEAAAEAEKKAKAEAKKNK